MKLAIFRYKANNSSHDFDLFDHFSHAHPLFTVPSSETNDIHLNRLKSNEVEQSLIAFFYKGFSEAKLCFCF